LSFIKSQKIPVLNQRDDWDVPVTHVSLTNDFLLPIVFDFQEQHFDDILTGYDNEPVIAFHLSSVSQNLDVITDICDIEVLDELCDEVRHFHTRILFKFYHDSSWNKLLVIFGSYVYSIWQVLYFTSFHTDILNVDR
jgi:hypothetical protein